jgi:tetratricopeptide (TPR) repeat protein
VKLVGVSLRVAGLALLITFSAGASSQAAVADKEICDVRADLALGLEDYPTAIMLHSNFLRSHPNDALAHYHLGFAYGMLGRQPEEISEYRAAANLGLDKWDLFLNLGLAYLDDGKLAQAAAALEHAVFLRPEQAESHFNLALVYEREARLGEALREITTCRSLDPADPDKWNTNAIICTEIGDLACADDIWTHLSHAVPDYRPARANLMILREAQMARFEKAPLDSRLPKR